MSAGRPIAAAICLLWAVAVSPAGADDPKEEPLVLESEDCREVHSDNVKPCDYHMLCDGEKTQDADRRECTERSFSRICCRRWSSGNTECDPSIFVRKEWVAPPPLIAGCVTKVEAEIVVGPY